MSRASQAARLRRLALADMDAAASIHRAAFDDRLPWLSGLHTPDDDRAYFRDRVFPACTVWGAFGNDSLVGFVAFRDGWIDQLYVLPEAQNQGFGTTLLAVAQAASATLTLWTFQRNAGARAFYEAHGFEIAETTDGSGNDEREPDVRYRWIRP